MRSRIDGGPVPGALDLALLACLGVFQLGLAHLAFSHGISGTPAVEASLLILLEPVLNPVCAFRIGRRSQFAARSIPLSPMPT